MRLVRCLIFFINLSVGLVTLSYSASLDSLLLNSQPIKFSIKPEVVFKSTDNVNLDFPKKIVLSNDYKNLYFLGKKGLYTLNLSNYQASLSENKLILSKGRSATEALKRRLLIDSVESIEIKPDNNLISLKHINYNHGLISYQTYFQNLNFPYDDFITFNEDSYQYNSFKILNILSDHSRNYYFTAIDDIFQMSKACSVCKDYSIGGSETNGTFSLPNIYKIQDIPQVKFNLYNYPSSKLSPNFQKVGSGYCVFVEKNGNFYTIEEDKVIKWSSDGKISEIVAGGNGKGNALNQLLLNKYVQKPIEVDSSGNLIINDYFNHRVLFWPKGQKYGEVIASDKLNKIHNFLPNSIALDSHGNIYVSDESDNSQILKFKNCSYLIKPNINKISNEELLTTTTFQPNWYLNNILISNENSSSLKPKKSGFYKVQLSDSWGCTSAPSDSVYFDCIPAKPEVEQISKFELKANPVKDFQLYAGFSYSVSNYGLVKFSNLSKGHSEQTWIYPDGSTSIELNPSKYFTVSGTYLIKLQVKNLKGEILSYQDNIFIFYPKRANVSFTNIQGNTFKCNSYENEEVIFWDFGDGQTSTEKSPIHKFSPPSNRICLVKLLLKGPGYLREIKIYFDTYSNSDLQNGKIVDIPIGNYNSIWSDQSGFSNDANFNGKKSILTNQGIFPGYSFSSINLPGCVIGNLNERIQIPNSKTLNNFSEITFSGWFGLDPSISMDPIDGACKPNGRQVLFSKGGDGFGTSPPGFNSFLDIKNKEITLTLEFSKNSGDFSINIPITKWIDTVKTQEKYEKISFISGYTFDSFGNNIPIISSKFRLGEYVSPFQHFVISFSESKVVVYLNQVKIYENTHLIKFNEINAQDLYVGVMGPKATPFNSIKNWYPFKGRIDKIKVFNRLIKNGEVYSLFSEKYEND